jgi:uncharacterized membrane protein YfcA
VVLIDVVLALFQGTAGLGSTTPPASRPPVRWSTLRLWCVLVVLGAFVLPMVARSLPGTGTALAVAWITAAFVLPLVAASCWETERANRKRARGRRQPRANEPER